MGLRCLSNFYPLLVDVPTGHGNHFSATTQVFWSKAVTVTTRLCTARSTSTTADTEQPSVLARFKQVSIVYKSHLVRSSIATGHNRTLIKIKARNLIRLLSSSLFPSTTNVHLRISLSCHHLRRESLRFRRRNHRWLPSGISYFYLILNFHSSYMLQGLALSARDIQVQLSRRRPGQSDLTTPVSFPILIYHISTLKSAIERREGSRACTIWHRTRCHPRNAHRPPSQERGSTPEGLFRNRPLPSSKSRRLHLPRKVWCEG